MSAIPVHLSDDETAGDQNPILQQMVTNRKLNGVVAQATQTMASFTTQLTPIHSHVGPGTPNGRPRDCNL